jgi:lipopolysaccharide export system protein LptA
MRRLLRTIVSLVIVLAAYGVYAITAVPLIDPPARAAGGKSLSAPLPVTPNDTPSADESMLGWFGPDPRAWELNKPKMLRNDRGILLFQNYYSDPEKLGPGKVSLEPVSMVFLSDDETLDPKVRQRQAVVLQAPAGAVLDFDKQFNIRRGDVGKLRGGTLRGKITIRSEGKLPGPEDDLWITTHDVRLTATRIWTSDKVQFEYGLNRGQGEELEIKLASPEERGSSRLGQIKSLTLKKNVVLNLVVKDSAPGRAGPASFGPASFGSLAMASQPQPREFSPDQPIVVQQGSPVTVHCQGPLHIDGQENVATFEQRVVVVRQFPSGEPDKLTCETLAIHFQPHDEPSQAKEGPKPKQDPKATADKTRTLEVRRVVARGNPAVLSAPGSGAFAQGQRLEYDMQTRRVSLVDEKEVVFRQQTNEVHAKELHYQPGADGRLGKFQAVGAGWLKWSTGDLRATADRAVPQARDQKPNRRFEATWRRQLHSYPHEGRQIISLEGEAKAQVTDMGRLDAEEIHAWLFEVPQAAPATTVSGQPQKQKYDLVPDRMLAQTNVVVDSPQVTGRMQKLEIFVHHRQEGQKRDQGSGIRDQGSGIGDRGEVASVGSTSRPSPLQQRVTGAPSAQQFDVTGQWVQVQLVQLGRQAELSQLDIFGNARLLETKTAKPDERPFLVEGKNVHATQAAPGAAKVTVSGAENIPAHVEGRGLSLTGGAINLDQGSNKLWIDGPGVMTQIVDGDLNGKKSGPPQPLHINWQGRMEFDGQRAVFDHAVVAKRQQESLQTQTLEVLLNRRIDMASPKQTDSQRPDIDQILCRGGLFLERRESDERGPSSHEKMQAVDLTIVRSSGAVLANGPGWITRWYRGSANTELNLPGFGAAAGPAATAKSPPGKPAAPRPTGAQAAPDETLNYLRVDFQQALRGNINERVMIFSDQVQTVHVPVKNWGETVNPDRPEQLGERGIVVKCDKLQLTEMQDPGPTQAKAKSFEVDAVSNAMAEGQTFTAKAARMSYSQGKDMLVMEGTGRTPAELWRQQTVGAPPSHLAAQRIEYHRQTNHISIKNAQYLDVTDLPTEKPGGRPKAPPGVKALGIQPR